MMNEITHIDAKEAMNVDAGIRRLLPIRLRWLLP
jgi:hypothetical protein